VAGVSGHVFVTAAREIDDDEIVLVEARDAFDEAGDGVGGFKRRDDTFGASKRARGIKRGGVRNGGIFGAALISKPSMLRADGGIVKTCGYRMCCGYLAVFGLQNVRISALENAWTCPGEALRRGEARRVLAESIASAAGFDADELYL
jgi:hypothetical protein